MQTMCEEQEECFADGRTRRLVVGVAAGRKEADQVGEQQRRGGKRQCHDIVRGGVCGDGEHDNCSSSLHAVHCHRRADQTSYINRLDVV